MDSRIFDVIPGPPELTGTSGRKARWPAACTDIDDRTRAEDELRASEERHRLIAELTTDFAFGMSFVEGGQPRTEWFTEGLTKLTGFTLDEVIARGDWPSVVHPDDLHVTLASVEALRGGSRSEAEVRLVAKSGKVLWVRYLNRPVFDESGETVIGFVGAAQDITERKLAEQALRASEQRFARFMQHLPGLAWIKDSQGRYVYANDSAERAFGVSPGALYGRTDEEVFPAETAALFREHDHRALDSGQGIQVIETLEHGDGTVHHSLVSKFPIPGPDGGEVLVGGMAIDITDRLEMEDALREADRRKDDFLATLAHELRNPLAPIANTLQLMAHPDESGRGYEAERAMAERQVAHLSRLVADLMDVARIRKGKIQLRKEIVELNTLVNHAIDATRPLIAERRHALVVALPPGPVRLDADPARLEQVLSNLLANAAKYTQPGGRITLSAACRDGDVEIRVADNGIGIPPDNLASIFEMFVQVGEHADHSQGGLGIGLCLVRTLVESHGGSISATSRGPNAGSEFVVRLPVRLQGQAEDDRTPARDSCQPENERGRRRILVVDDNEDAASSLATLLIRVYHQDVRIARDGHEALALVEDFRPELVLLDIGMPGMDGYEVARRLRASPEFRDVPLIAVTGWGQEQDRQSSREAGFDRHLVKPVDPAELRDLLSGPSHTASPVASVVLAGSAGGDGRSESSIGPSVHLVAGAVTVTAESGLPRPRPTS